MYHHLVSAVTDTLSIYLWFGFFCLFYLLTSGRHSQEKALSGKLILCFFFLNVVFLKGFLGGSDGKASVCNAGDLGSTPGLGC